MDLKRPNTQERGVSEGFRTFIKIMISTIVMAVLATYIGGVPNGVGASLIFFVGVMYTVTYLAARAAYIDGHDTYIKRVQELMRETPTNPEEGE